MGRAVETQVRRKQQSRDRAMPAISIVVVSRRPSLALARLLRSLRRAERIEEAEVLLGLTGGSEYVARRLVGRLLPGVSTQIVTGVPRPPAAARNDVLAHAAAPLLVFLDDDVEVPPGFLSDVIDVMEDESVLAAGGPNLTPPSGSQPEQLAGRVLASPIGTGPLRNRYRSGSAGSGTGRNLMLCNLVVRRAAGADPLFDGRLASAEENELLARMGRGGARIEYRPELAVYHHRRDRLSLHFRQMLKYGYGRGQMLIHAFSPGQLIYTVPSLALVALLGAALFDPIIPLAAFLAWFGVIVAGSLRAGGMRHAHKAFGLFAATHIAYALALIGGVFSGAWRAVVDQGTKGRQSATARDAVGTFAALGIAVASASAAGVVVARALGPEGRGHFELTRTLALSAALVAGLGLGRAAIFHHGRGRIGRGALFGAVAGALPVGALMAAALAALLLAGGWHGLATAELVLACVSLPLIAFYFQGHYALRGIGKEAAYRRVLAVRDGLFLVLLVPLLLLGLSVTLVVSAWALHWLLGAMGIAWLLTRACGPPRRPPVGALKPLALFGASQAALSVLMFLHLRFDLVILRWFEDAGEVGQYAVAFGVSEPLSYVGLAIGLVLFPRTVMSTISEPAGGRDRTEKALRTAVALALGGALLLGIAAPTVVESLFGAAFKPAVVPLRLLLPGVVALAALLVLQSDLAGRGRIWEVVGVYASAVALNAALAVALIPQFGAAGAAAASSTTHMLAAASLLVLFRRATELERRGVPAGVFDQAGIGIS